MHTGVEPQFYPFLTISADRSFVSFTPRSHYRRGNRPDIPHEVGWALQSVPLWQRLGEHYSRSHFGKCWVSTTVGPTFANFGWALQSFPLWQRLGEHYSRSHFGKGWVSTTVGPTLAKVGWALQSAPLWQRENLSSLSRFETRFLGRPDCSVATTQTELRQFYPVRKNSLSNVRRRPTNAQN